MAGLPDLPLAGIRLLDLTTVLFGPITTQLMGDLGADVIKIEAPGGDATRHVGPSRSPGMGALFMGANRNKRSIELDLKRPEAKAALWRLIDRADVFVHNIRPQKIRALGFDPDAVMARNPRIVYGGLHGYGEDGPYGGRPAYDDVIQGQSGLAGTFTARDGEPTLVPSTIADKTAALVAMGGLLAALVRRERTGRGGYVECSMFEALVGYNLLEHHYGAMFQPPLSGYGYPRMLSAQRRPHRTRDGHICMLAYTDRQWRSFWRLAGRPELAADERFATMRERSRNIDALYEAAGAILSGRTTAEWLEILGAAEIPCGPVNGFEDVRADPHLNAIGFFRPYDHPSEGPLEIPDAPWRFDRGSLPVRVAQPALGEHGHAILREAGCSEAEIERLLNAAEGDPSP
ncbi:MAG TPA: CoA transferase [Geminicoccaceae bacterium]